MFLSKKKEYLSNKDLMKKIDFYLKDNFFSVDQVVALSDRKLKKLIKLIFKLEGIKPNREDLRQFVEFFRSSFNVIKENVSKIWKFVIKLKVKVKKIVTYFIDWTYFCKQESYRENKFELMLN